MSRQTAALAALAILVGTTLARADENKKDVAKELRVEKSVVKSYGTVKIDGNRWCFVVAEASESEATTGKYIGERLFGSKAKEVCALLLLATEKRIPVDISALPERTAVDPTFLGRARPLHIIGYTLVHFGAAAK